MSNVNHFGTASRIVEGKVKSYRPIFLALALCIQFSALSENSFAELRKDAPEDIRKRELLFEKCNKEIGAAVPAFTCKGDGVLVPKTVDSNGKCTNPEDLHARCIFQSRLGRLPVDNKDVDIIFSCRKSHSPLVTHKTNTDNKFYDFAVIQHNRKTGKTCFYQYFGPTSKDFGPSGADGEKVPGSSAKGAKFWNYDVDFCTSCHSNGPFIRSPHYWNFDKTGKVLQYDDPDDRILPSEGDIDKYEILHKHYEVFDVSKSGNACNGCHNIGAYKTDDGKLHLGQVNKLAAGEVKSLKSWDSPTSDGYHDFMSSQLSGSTPTVRRNKAKAAVQELVACVASPTSTGCTVTQITHNPPAPASTSTSTPAPSPAPSP
ncbi:hypothetical protein NTGBS_890007 [Candidatus Nitrotoga sp. BS]|uniref:hypothetical protein n=1 Tax=Candidatus Nitrotoga sp. BS TaxID=2890408 RepID=UPI001EF19A7B|nr:hypothetical protein [Candidatus Nitrotoga sp. BS]CAH1211307.1 hypothetical protein NTGBS_890007 [Candidatus Nitrotoga sp. BS]